MSDFIVHYIAFPALLLWACLVLMAAMKVSAVWAWRNTFGEKP